MEDIILINAKLNAETGQQLVNIVRLFYKILHTGYSFLLLLPNRKKGKATIATLPSKHIVDFV